MMTTNRAEIVETHELIRAYLHRTPILQSNLLNQKFGCRLYFKCENFQKIGAFKMRGAIHFLLRQKMKGPKEGQNFVTHSSGNHAQALALAAHLMKANAFIVMPENAPRVKIEAVKAYGAEVHFCKANLAAREDKMTEIKEKKQAIFVPPYDHPDIILGQATAAKEMFEDMSEKLDFLLCPVGGGGLLAGSAISRKYFSPTTAMIGCEPVNADDAYQSFQQKTWVPPENPNTIADGLKTSLGKLNIEIILKKVDQILRCEEDSIVKAMRLIWERMKIIVEPSAAVPLACLMENQQQFKNKTVGIILSGGNVDLNPFFDHFPE